jgi:hypothetical protein
VADTKWQLSWKLVGILMASAVVLGLSSCAGLLFAGIQSGPLSGMLVFLWWLSVFGFLVGVISVIFLAVRALVRKGRGVS